METKICSYCKRELPLDSNHFYKQNRRGRNGFTPRCRECLGYKFIPITKEGYQVCVKCGEELLLTKEFYSPSKSTYTGFLRSCRECQRQKSMEWKINNPDKLKEYSKRRWEENKDSEKARFREYYYDNHGKNKERAREYFRNNPEKSRLWRIDNAEKVRASYQKYRKNNRAKYLASLKRYRENNRDLFSAYRKVYYDKNRDELNAKKREKTANMTEEERLKRRDYNNRTREKRRIYTVRYRTLKKNQIATFTQEDWQEVMLYFGNSCAYCGSEADKFEQDHVIPVSKNGSYVRSNIVPACKSCNASKSNSDMREWFSGQQFFCEKRLSKVFKWINYNPKTKTQQLTLF